jgi:hypothetical protein
LPVEVPQPAEALVRCERSIHRIAFDGSGICLPNHPDPDQEAILIEFGWVCRCHVVRHAWEHGRRNVLPRPLQASFDSYRIAALWKAYEESGCAKEGRAALKRLKKALDKRTDLTIKSVFRACDCRTPPSGGRTVWVWVEGEPSVSAECYRRFHRPVPWWLRVMLKVRPDWYHRVYERGLAVIDGKFVLDILTADAPWSGALVTNGHQVPVPAWVAALGNTPDLSEGPLALAVYQARGYKVCARPARVVTEVGPDGKQRTVLRPLTVPSR